MDWSSLKLQVKLSVFNYVSVLPKSHQIVWTSMLNLKLKQTMLSRLASFGKTLLRARTLSTLSQESVQQLKPALQAFSTDGVKLSKLPEFWPQQYIPMSRLNDTNLYLLNNAKIDSGKDFQLM